MLIGRGAYTSILVDLHYQMPLFYWSVVLGSSSSAYAINIIYS
jgi:hypothetical protein